MNSFPSSSLNIFGSKRNTPRQISTDLPSLTNLSWVSRFQDLSHALTSWQLISHAFSKRQTPKKFWSCRARFQFRYQQITSSIQGKRLAVVFDYILLAYRDLPLPPNVQTSKCFSCFKMPATKTEKLHNLNRKTVMSTAPACDFQIPIIPTRKFRTYHDFLPISFSTSWFRVSHFLPLGVWQVWVKLNAIYTTVYHCACRTHDLIKPEPSSCRNNI